MMADEPNLNVDVELDLNGADRALDELTRKADAFGGALSGALKSATVDGRGLDDVLRNLGNRMVSIALDAGTRPLEQLVSNSISGLSGSLGRMLPFAKGGVPGRLNAFADGGVIGGPSYFPMQGGDVGLMGEAGAEAILPLSRGPDGRLGVASGGATQPVQVTFNVTTPDAASFSKSEAQVTAMLARTVGRGRRGL
jgi:phage-related minor tail protein